MDLKSNVKRIDEEYPPEATQDEIQKSEKAKLIAEIVKLTNSAIRINDGKCLECGSPLEVVTVRSYGNTLVCRECGWDARREADRCQKQLVIKEVCGLLKNLVPELTFLPAKDETLDKAKFRWMYDILAVKDGIVLKQIIVTYRRTMTYNDLYTVRDNYNNNIYRYEYGADHDAVVLNLLGGESDASKRLVWGYAKDFIKFGQFIPHKLGVQKKDTIVLKELQKKDLSLHIPKHQCLDCGSIAIVELEFENNGRKFPWCGVCRNNNILQVRRIVFQDSIAALRNALLSIASPLALEPITLVHESTEPEPEQTLVKTDFDGMIADFIEFKATGTINPKNIQMRLLAN